MRVLAIFMLLGSTGAIPSFMHLIKNDKEITVDTTPVQPSSDGGYSPFFDVGATPGPTVVPTPVPTRLPTLSPTPSPTNTITQTPTTQAPVTASPTTLAPTTATQAATTAVPTNSPNLSTLTSSPTPSPTNLSSTREAFYQFEWGGISNGCQYKAPRSIVMCMGGGVMQIRDLSNAECEMLSVDVAKCSQVESEGDPVVDFSCAGNTATQLAANAKTLRSEAVDCIDFDGTSYGGDVVTAASLGRFCRDPSTNSLVLDKAFTCEEGIAGSMGGDDRFCASPNSCKGVDCKVPISPISIMAYTQDLMCSTPAVGTDLTNYEFKPSSLASYHLVDWTFSDERFECEWAVPDIEVRCANGGTPRLGIDVDFCTIGEDVITCTNPNPVSNIGRVTVELDFWCFGSNPEQLILEAKTLDVTGGPVTCQPKGLLVQGLAVSRGCGNIDSPSFTLFSGPEFCANPSQFYEGLCFEGFACPAEGDGCEDVSVVPVTADTSDLVVSSCIYAL